MASTFKNAGATLTTTDSGAFYTAGGSGQAVIHASIPLPASPKNHRFASGFAGLIQTQGNADAKTLALITLFLCPRPASVFPMKASQKMTTSLFVASSQAAISPAETALM